MKKRDADPEEDEPTAPFWMTTFSDMMTLLLTFFILIVSYSTIELEKFKGAMESFKGALGIMPKNLSSFKKDQTYIRLPHGFTSQEQGLVEQATKIQQALSDLGLQDDAWVEISNGGILVRLGNNILFDSGKAQLKDKARLIISAIVRVIKGKFKEIYVEGHTDDIPIHTERYPSNWELSAARALSVVRYLHDVEKIPESMLAAVGHGEHRPLVPNTTPENRAKNRRVEIFIKLK